MMYGMWCALLLKFKEGKSENVKYITASRQKEIKIKLETAYQCVTLASSPIGVSYWQTRTSKTPSPTSYSGPAKQLFLSKCLVIKLRMNHIY